MTEVDSDCCKASGADSGRVVFPSGLKIADLAPTEAKLEDVDRERKSMVVRISTDALDRDKEVLLPSGVQLEQYRKNPVVLYAHDYEGLPIGKSLWEKSRAHDVIAKPQFSQRNEFAMQVFELYADEVLRGWSVGFQPVEGGARPPTEDEIRKRPDWAGCRQIYDNWELWEYSGCAVPANPDALSLAVKTGKIQLPERILAGLELPDVGEPFPWEKPYPNEHACRKRNPDDFQQDSFRRVDREHEGKRYAIIMGRLKGEDTMTEQAYRYPKDVWSVAEARSHCKSHDGIGFEPAKDAILEQAKVHKILTVPKIIAVVRPDEVCRLVDAKRAGRVTHPDD